MRFLLLQVILLCVCLTTNAEPDSHYLDEGAYYNYRHWECRVGDDKAYLTGRAKITILNAKGDDHNLVSFNENDFVKLKKCSARLIDSSGTVVKKIEKKELNESCGFGTSFQLYNDICYYYAEMPSPRYPYSIEYEYEQELKSLFFLRGVDLQQSIPVEEAIYELVCPDDFGLSYKLYGSDAVPAIASQNGKSSYIWELHDIPEFVDIDYAIDGSPEPISLLLVADEFRLSGYEFKGISWENIGQWYNDLSGDCYMVGENNIETIEVSDKLATAEEIYNKIIDDTRYVSVSIKISGWKPNKAEDVSKRNYGDCKDLTTLLISRLRSKGIEAYPCLALTRGSGKLDEEFPNFGFNHVFCMAIVEGDTVWMDPTCSQCSFGSLPDMDNDIPVLVVNDNGSSIIRTPQTSPEDGKIVMVSKILMDKDGNAVIETSKSYYGHYARSSRSGLLHLDKDETEVRMCNVLPGSRKRFKLVDYEIENLNDREEPLIIRLKAVRKKKLDQYNNTIYIQPSILESEDIFEAIETTNRTVPINLGLPWQKE